MLLPLYRDTDEFQTAHGLSPYRLALIIRKPDGMSQAKSKGLPPAVRENNVSSGLPGNLEISKIS